jgi:ABC-type branched-subunit amino acid transport system substrate-binding protein
MKYLLLLGLGLMLIPVFSIKADNVVIGLNYPASGPQQVQGLAQLQATKMAVEEINANGGIAGKTIKLVAMDSQSDAEVAAANVEIMIDKYGAQMLLGGATNEVAITSGKIAKSRNKLYFGTMTYANATTGKAGHTHMFRECYNTWMAAKVLAQYLKEHYASKKFAFVTADHNVGRNTEQHIRQFGDINNLAQHKQILLPKDKITQADLKKALTLAQDSNADVLVLVLSGQEMTNALTLTTLMGLKQQMTVVVPNITLGMAKLVGPKTMEGVISTLPWSWKIPFDKGYKQGVQFVNRFAARYKTYPSSSAASAYTIIHQYHDAVERAKSFATTAVIAQLESHRFSLLKDQQLWRAFDHQNVQTVFVVKGKPQVEVLKDKYRADYFQIMASMRGVMAARSKAQWDIQRQQAGATAYLQ